MATNYSGNSTPTLNNAPASSWTDDAAKHSHVGNTYLVTGSGGTAGNVYAFEEYPTPLIKNASGLPADIVTITDGGENKAMTHAQLTLSPIQSLNGYDHPWAGGAGKNKFPTATATSSGSSNIFNNFALSAPSGTYTLSFTSNTSRTKQMSLNFGLSDSTSVEFAIAATDSKATFTANASITKVTWYVREATDIKEIQLEAGNERTAFAPYENLCPISGHTQATLNRTGKNLLDISNVIEDAYIFGDTGRITSIAGANVFWAAVPKNTDVHLKMNNGNRLVMALFNSEPQLLDYGEIVRNHGVQMLEATINTGDYSYVAIYPNRDQASRPTEIQLEIGSEATDYVPSEAQTFTLSLGQTVYGGKIDLVTGEGEITWATHEVTTSEGDTATIGGAFCRRINIADLKTDGNRENYILSHFTKPTGAISSNPANGVASNVYWNTNNITMRNDALTTRAEWDNWVTAQATAGTPVTICYKLATPISLSLTGQQIQTLLGLNNVWGDNGQISELQYRSNQFTPAWQWFETWTMPKITRDNGTVIVLPYPQEYTPEIYDVDAATTGRNAAGTMIRDRVARKHKFNYKFPPLSQADATEILGAVQDVSFTLTTASPETGAKTNYRVYVGDRSLPVYWMPTHDNASWLYSSLSLNLIEM